MIRRCLRVASMLAASVLPNLAACNGKVADPPPDPTTVEGYCYHELDVYRAKCAYLQRCCSGEELALTDLIGSCSLEGAVDSCIASTKKRIAAGEIWSGEHAAACIAEYRAGFPAPPTTCKGLYRRAFDEYFAHEPSTALAPSCWKMLHGARPLGAACTASKDCDVDLFCDEAATPHVCAAQRDRGASCRDAIECKPGLRCVGPGEHHCDTLRVAGDACSSTTDCVVDLSCVGGHCAKLQGAGESCVSAECGHALSCDPKSRVCVPDAAPDGSSCIADWECAGLCDETAGKCVPVCGGTIQ